MADIDNNQGEVLRVLQEDSVDNTRGVTQRVIEENTINNMRGVTKRVYVVGGGGTPINNQDITVTVNGSYTADEGYTGLGTVTVNVPNPSTGTKSITANGVYDVTNYASADVQVQQPYPLLIRVKDDNNNEIGTVCSYRTDANNQKYAVVCLDAQYRSSSGQYLSARVEVTGITLLNDQTLWENKDTATSNCTKILDFANANGYTSSAVSHCRSKSFVIEGVTYYGQLPTIFELSDIFSHRTAINNSDTSASQYSSLIVPTSTNTWSSSQYSSNGGFYLNSIGTFSSNGAKDANYFVMPILEIPIE